MFKTKAYLNFRFFKKQIKQLKITYYSTLKIKQGDYLIINLDKAF